MVKATVLPTLTVLWPADTEMPAARQVCVISRSRAQTVNRPIAVFLRNFMCYPRFISA